MTSPPKVFVNVPYDADYEGHLDLIEVALYLYDLHPLLMGDDAEDKHLPEATRIPQRLLRNDVIGSIHDLARDRGAGLYLQARLNMPFELGAAVAAGHQRDASRTTVLVLHPSSVDVDTVLSDLMPPPGQTQQHNAVYRRESYGSLDEFAERLTRFAAELSSKTPRSPKGAVAIAAAYGPLLEDACRARPRRSRQQAPLRPTLRFDVHPCLRRRLLEQAIQEAP